MKYRSTEISTRRARLAACALLGCLAWLALGSCASLAPAELKQQSGYYYGTGSGATADEAAAAAKRDLIANALTETARSRGLRAERIEVAPEAAAAFQLPRLKRVARQKAEGWESVALSIKAAEWDEYERAREAAIRTELQARLATLRDGRGQLLAERMAEAARILDRLAGEGLTDLLTESEQGGLLLSQAVASYCLDACTGLSISISPEGGFVGEQTRFEAAIRDAQGAPAGFLPLRAQWSAADSSSEFTRASSGPDGRLTLSYPPGASFRNTAVRLSLGTDFAGSAPSSTVFEDIDAATRLQVSFRHFDDVAEFFSREVLVPGGPFTAGAVAQDKRATRKEAPRPAETTDFAIDLYPVTNALYGMYLEDTQAEAFPEYWDNPRYNRPDQPVIGISYDDAASFASWLSARLGVVKRLPTEEEWEKAARGGREVIYPWGDESPTDGVRANYSGNGRYSGPSPVGSFEAGKNAQGLFDMAGNVWEWTSTHKDVGTVNRIVKGGSWLDGPADLRVSNRRELDPSRGYVDVGFRLVREVTSENE